MYKIYVFFIFIIITPSYLFGQYSNIKDLQKALDNNYYIYNVIELDKANVAIVKEYNNLDNSTYDTAFIIAFDKNDRLIDYKKATNRDYFFDPPFFLTNSIFIIEFNYILYKFDTNTMKFQLKDNVFAAVVYIKDGFIFAENAPPGARISKYNINTLDLVSEYSSNGKNISEMFKDIDEIGMKPLDISKQSRFINISKILGIAFLIN